VDFDFSDEQRQFRDSVARYLAEQYGFDRYQAVRRSSEGWDRALWRGLAELGVLGMSVPESAGGLGLGPLETLLVMSECGRNHLLEPVLASAVIATAALRAFASEEAAASLLRSLAGGERIAALAHFESDARFEPRWVSTAARRAGVGWVLDGHKGVVPHAPTADVLLVSARTHGEPGDDQGVSLFLVPRGQAGLALDSYPLLDGQPAADVYLRGVAVPAESQLGPEGAAWPAIEAALGEGLAALCADTVGAMQALLDATVAYVKERRQFGQPIGQFQALQHRIADMLVHLEQARSMSFLASLRCDSRDLGERRRALSAAKVVVGQSARFLGQQAIQLHGGMGMTDEMRASHWFRRLTVAQILFGDSDMHLQRFAALTQRAAS
jgi:alkylation response protein AidB-like acyl-CoA dehydrogenase